MAACIGGELIANRAPGLGVDRPPNAGSGKANPCGQSDRRKFGLREACRCVHARRVCAALVGSAVVLDLVLSPRRGQARGDPGGTDNMKQCLPCPGSRAESSPRTIFQLAPFEPRNRFFTAVTGVRIPLGTPPLQRTIDNQAFFGRIVPPDATAGKSGTLLLLLRASSSGAAEASSLARFAFFV